MTPPIEVNFRCFLNRSRALGVGVAVAIPDFRHSRYTNHTEAVSAATIDPTNLRSTLDFGGRYGTCVTYRDAESDSNHNQGESDSLVRVIKSDRSINSYRMQAYYDVNQLCRETMIEFKFSRGSFCRNYTHQKEGHI